MNDAFHLSLLQKIDTRLAQLDRHLAEIRNALAEDSQLQAAISNQESASKQAEVIRKQLLGCESQVESQRIKIEQSEASLYGGKIHNPKELQDVQAELASLKKQLSKLEDLQLDAMMALENAETDLSAANQSLQKVQADKTGQNAGLLGEKSRLEKEREKAVSEREAALSSVGQEILQTYNRLKQQKHGIAVAAVIEESCEACGASLTPADQQAARSPVKIVYCPSCGRILYSG
jgi:uncharacterized protein